MRMVNTRNATWEISLNMQDFVFIKIFIQHTYFRL
jgi:hypothetical protein